LRPWKKKNSLRALYGKKSGTTSCPNKPGEGRVYRVFLVEERRVTAGTSSQKGKNEVLLPPQGGGKAHFRTLGGEGQVNEGARVGERPNENVALFRGLYKTTSKVHSGRRGITCGEVRVYPDCVSWAKGHVLCTQTEKCERESVLSRKRENHNNNGLCEGGEKGVGKEGGRRTRLLPGETVGVQGKPEVKEKKGRDVPSLTPLEGRGGTPQEGKGRTIAFLGVQKESGGKEDDQPQCPEKRKRVMREKFTPGGRKRGRVGESGPRNTLGQKGDVKSRLKENKGLLSERG